MMKKFLLILCLLFAFGSISACSAKQAISEAATDIQNESIEGKGHLNDARQAIELGEDPLPAIDSADLSFDEIYAAASIVHRKLPETEDKTPWWATWSMVVLGSIAIIAILIYLGPAIGRIINTVVLTLTPAPRGTKAEAKLFAEGDVPAALAVKRQADPRFDKEYQKAKKAKILKDGGKTA